MLHITTLASGSSGNSLLARGDGHCVLIDAGISARRITTALRGLGVDPGEVTAVCITHDHTDHTAGLATLTKQYGFTLWASPATGARLCARIPRLEERFCPILPGASADLGGLELRCFATQHDTAGSVGYVLSDGSRKAGVVTDLGVVTPEVEAAVLGCGLLVVETNHDPEMVRCGPYPYFLKERILGDYGHLSNGAGAGLACRAAEWGARTLVLAHLSQENNAPRLALRAVNQALAAAGAAAHPAGDVTVAVAPRCETGETYLA